MSGTKKKPRQTSESMESPSAKQRRSSTTPTQASNRTLSGKKSDSESQAGRKEAQKSSSLSLSTVRSRQGKKSTESSAHDALIQKRKRVWQGYDNESLPELKDDQILDLAENSVSYRTWLKERRKRRGQRDAS